MTRFCGMDSVLRLCWAYRVHKASAQAIFDAYSSSDALLADIFSQLPPLLYPMNYSLSDVEILLRAALLGKDDTLADLRVKYYRSLVVEASCVVDWLLCLVQPERTRNVSVPMTQVCRRYDEDRLLYRLGARP